MNYLHCVQKFYAYICITFYTPEARAGRGVWGHARFENVVS